MRDNEEGREITVWGKGETDSKGRIYSEEDGETSMSEGAQ